MSSRDQDPWQRRMRQSREERGSLDVPANPVPRRPPPPAPSRDAEPEVDTQQPGTPEARPQSVRGPGVAPLLAASPDTEGDSVWRASASFGKLIGFLLVATFAVLAIVSFWRYRVTDGVWGWPALPAAIMLLAATAGTIYILRGLATIRYVLGRERLTIVWMGQQRVVAYDDIQEVVYEPRSVLPRRGYESFWPGYHVSTMQMRDGAWQSVATQAPHRRIRIRTRTAIYALSPRRPVLFLGELARRRHFHATGMREYSLPPIVQQPPLIERGPKAARGVQAAATTSPERVAWDQPGRTTVARADTEPRTDQRRDAEARRPGRVRSQPKMWPRAYIDLFRQQLLGDQVASTLVAVGVMLPLLMTALLYSQYEGISGVVPLHWDAHGNVDAVGSARDLWRFPLMSVFILVLNTTLATALLAVDRFMARFLVAVTPGAQLIVFIALIRAVT